MIKRLFCLLLALVIILVAVQAVSFLFPMRYKKEIQQYAKQNGLDPALIAAQIKVESNYDEQAVSRRGAVGLMQVLPSTGVWCAKEMQIQAYTDDMLTTPKINLQIGIWYDAYLLQQTESIEWMLAAYNGGIANVEAWRADGITRIDEIPFPETRDYVRKALAYQKIYTLLYRF